MRPRARCIAVVSNSSTNSEGGAPECPTHDQAAALGDDGPRQRARRDNRRAAPFLKASRNSHCLCSAVSPMQGYAFQIF